MANAGEPLRVGLLVDTLQLPAWVRTIIADIQASQYARIVLVIKKDGPPRAPASLARRIWRRRSRLAYLAYRWLDERAFRTSDDAFAREDVADLLAQAALVRVTVKETRFCDYLSDEDVAQIREARPDVLLRFGFRILKGPILQAAKYGVWSYHHGDNHVNRGGPAGFWEVMHERPTTGSVLQILNEDLDNGRVIYRWYAKTDRSSVWRNRNNYYWKSAAFVTRKLRELSEYGPAALEACSCSRGCNDVRFYSERLFRKPDNLETLSLVGRYLVGARARAYPASTRSRSVGHRVFAVKEGVPSTTLYRFKEQWPAIGSSWADPFPVEAGDDYHVFLEVYDYAKQHGRIGVSRLTRDGAFERPVTVLERPYHLSYPFVFRWRGTWFMMPESSKASRIEVFSARQFPWEWTPEAVLFDSVHAVDSTLVSVEGRWWLFTNVSPHPAIRNDDELYAFHGPDSVWPVDAPPSKSREVGCSFSACGRKLLLEGKGVVQAVTGLQRQVRLRNGHQPRRSVDPGVFQETIVARVEPRWRSGLSGTHTLNSCSGLTVIDFRHRRARTRGRAKYFGRPELHSWCTASEICSLQVGALPVHQRPIIGQFRKRPRNHGRHAY